jgi:methyl-accepting chemotaxis protein
MADEAGKVIRSKLDIQFNSLGALADSDSIKGDELTLDKKLELLNSEVGRSSHIRIGIADLSGNIKYNDGESLNISDMNYFKKAISGNNAVSDPIKVDNNAVMCFADPIKDGDTIKGVLVAMRDGNELSAYTSVIQFREKRQRLYDQ